MFRDFYSDGWTWNPLIQIWTAGHVSVPGLEGGGDFRGFLTIADNYGILSPKEDV